MSCVFFFVQQKTAYDMRMSAWSSDVCSSDLSRRARAEKRAHLVLAGARVADPIARRGQAGAGLGVPDRRGRNAAGARADAGRVAGGSVCTSRARRRSEARRVGKECVRTCHYLWSRDLQKEKVQLQSVI